MTPVGKVASDVLMPRLRRARQLACLCVAVFLLTVGAAL